MRLLYLKSSFWLFFSLTLKKVSSVEGFDFIIIIRFFIESRSFIVKCFSLSSINVCRVKLIEACYFELNRVQVRR